MKFDNYYLDLKKVSKIDSEEERKQIHTYYMDMMLFSSENKKSMAVSIFNTLNQSGYLKEIRSEKIDKLLS
jgi:N-acetylneuraminic acid mutarotase